MASFGSIAEMVSRHTFVGCLFFLTKTYGRRYQESWFHYFFQIVLSMSYLSKNLLAALVGVAVLSSCSRPVAYFQKSQRENFKATPVEHVAVVTPIESVQPAVETPAAVATPSPAEPVAQAKAAMNQLDAYVKNDSKLAGNRKLAKRMARANALLAEAEANPTAVTAPHKATFMERIVLKKLDRKIKSKMAPEQTKAFLDNKIRNGVIVGAIGLVLAIFVSGVVGVIGSLLLAAGIVLIVWGVLET